jgi:FMN phosphatase YigB (HAD superfamily)
MMPKQKVTVLITDLDNTLFDWVEIWCQCFSAMLAEIVSISGVPAEQLKSEIRTVHQFHGTSEYAFLIEELPSLRLAFPGGNLAEIFSPAIEAFRKTRRTYLKLFPGVAETLLKIKGKGTSIIGYTESMAFYSNYRVRRLGLDGVLDIIYSPQDHSLPHGIQPDDIRKYSARTYKFRYTQEKFTPKGELKPNPDILKSIISELKVSQENCLYLGDSLFKDVAMAKDVGITSVWARYGVAQKRNEYELLREVTHWTDEDVQREKNISSREVSADYVLKENISEILQLADFAERVN